MVGSQSNFDMSPRQIPLYAKMADSSTPPKASGSALSPNPFRLGSVPATSAAGPKTAPPVPASFAPTASPVGDSTTGSPVGTPTAASPGAASTTAVAGTPAHHTMGVVGLLAPGLSPLARSKRDGVDAHLQAQLETIEGQDFNKKQKTLEHKRRDAEKAEEQWRCAQQSLSKVKQDVDNLEGALRMKRVEVEVCEAEVSRCSRRENYLDSQYQCTRDTFCREVRARFT